MKRNTESFKKELAEINPNIEVLGKYVKVHQKVLYRCKICGHEWKAEPNSVLHGIGCPECGKKKSIASRKTGIEKLKIQLKEKNPTVEYYSGEYKNTDSKLFFKCLRCGNVFEATPHSILRAKFRSEDGNGCPKCKIKKCHLKNAKTHEQFLEDFNKIGLKIDINSAYINNKTYIDCKCQICGHIWKAIPNHLLQGHGCPNCAHLKATKDTEYFINKALEVHGNIYDYSETEYTKSSEPVKIICRKHGPFWQEASAHLLGRGCPKCNRSHGETLISKWLENNNIKFEEQYKLHLNEIARDSNLVIIDFKININNKTYFIEYHGRQHYEYIEFFHNGNKINFEKQQNRDSQLRNYCKDNNIILIEIPYTVKNLTDLSNYLNILLENDNI